MKLHFTKMHGTGNDYVYVDLFRETVAEPEKLSVRVSDRHFGIGSDGLILITPSQTADCGMRIFNADGSEAQMCGNGIRCAAKYAYEHGIAEDTTVLIETKSGIKTIDLTVENAIVTYACVNMGEAVLQPEKIPVRAKGENFIDCEIEAAGSVWRATCVSMGNPHCVVFTENIDELDLEKIGPEFENHPMFPERINTEFVEVVNDRLVRMRVWERGSGETISCGTGTCAVTVASVLNGFCKRGTEIEIQIRGGSLFDTWMENGEVRMKGPATTVFEGDIEI